LAAAPDAVPADGDVPATYNAKNITVLEGLEAVRRRPGMYIGSTGARGLHHLIWEVVDNAVDEALADRCSEIEVTLLADGGVRVSDDGSGIPVDLHEKEGISALEVVLTGLHAGGKFDKQAYAVSGGLHGVGISVVNALSQRLVAEIRRDGNLWRQEFVRGDSQGPVEAIAESSETGTTITFWPDEQVFETVDFSADTIGRRLRDTAFLTAGLMIRFIDQRSPAEESSLEEPFEPTVEEFHAPGGLRDFVDHVRPRGRRTACTTSSTSMPRSRDRTGSSRSRSPSSGSTTSMTRSSPSATPSTPTRGGHTMRGSAPPSRRSSTGTRSSTTWCASGRSTRSPGTTSGRG
jgi:DNA gyrase subunit B